MTVTNKQVRILMKEKSRGTLHRAAMKSNMSDKTARKYVKAMKTPEELKKPRKHKTRQDPFNLHWGEILEMLSASPGLEAKTVINYLTEQYPEVYKPGQIRSLQRRLSAWRLENGSSKVAIFPQEYQPGRQSQSDWTDMNEINITISGNPFDHLLYHYVLSFSGFETVMLCYTESFDTLTKGYELAVLEAGGVCREHRTDNLTAATQTSGNSRVFTSRWRDFMAHYGVTPSRNNPGESHENGKVEKSHDLFKKAVNQELLLRRSRDFHTIEEYMIFINKIKDKRNFGRREKIVSEQRHLNPLPELGFNEATIMRVRVTSDSLVTVLSVRYSVPSRFIGQWLKAYIFRDNIQFYLADKLVVEVPRLEAGALINYRHIIDSLIRKPGAFENYQYRSYLFPNVIFRQAYDALENEGISVFRRYCQLLHLAKMEGESEVTAALELLLEAKELPLKERVSDLIASSRKAPDVTVNQPVVEDYDTLLTGVCA